MLTELQFPYTGEYGLASGPLKSKGPTAEACKRFYGRLGLIDWGDYDQHWNAMLGEVHADWKKRHGLVHDPSYGKLAWEKMRAQRVPKGRPHAGEWAFDKYSRKIVQDEAGVIADSQEMATIQRYIVEWWRIAINKKSIWHYSQVRPGDPSVAPDRGGYNDCSLAVIQAHNYAQRFGGFLVPDPAKQNYTGYGNTDWYLDDWPRIGSPFRVGDLAHFHSERHVIECIKPGTFSTAQWGSNGSEAAPELIAPLTSYYRFPEEFMFVVRPALTMEEL
jgi:hypothetical protein